MKFFKSTAGCGYNQYAIVTPIKKSEHGHDYLCIWTNEQGSFCQIHVEGEIVEDLEDIYVEEIEIDVSKYPILKNFLFQYFMQTFSFENFSFDYKNPPQN